MDNPIMTKLSMTGDAGLSGIAWCSAAGHFHGSRRLHTRRRAGLDHLVIWVTAGRTIGSCDGRAFEAGPGDLVVFRRGEAQDYAAAAGEPWEWWWAHGEGALADRAVDALRDAEDRPGVVPIGEDGRLRRTFAELSRMSRPYLETYRAQAVPEPRVIDATYALLLTLLLDRHRKPRSVSSRFDPDAIEGYIESRLTEPLRLDALAEQTHLSVPQFTRVFRQAMGCSPMQFVTRRRVEKAAVLLSETTAGVAQVAEAVGYEDALYFSRVFKKQYGLSPKAYRARTTSMVR